jgi:anaerobic magnesium-protoporphyrin IX monomethyl ester cyclase
VKILLVVPRTLGSPYGFTNFPVGIAYISSTLKKADHDVHVLDLNDYYCTIFHGSIMQMMLKRKIMEINPHIVATGGLSAIYDQIHAICEITKSLNPNLITIIGGGCVSSEPELIMENVKADFGVIGEGEVTILELLEQIENKTNKFNKVDGIIFKKDFQFIMTKSRKPIENLDEVPLPDYEGFNISAYLDRQTLTDQDIHPYNTPRIFEIAASRSCPFKCTFCFHPVGDKYRKRSIESVISEIEYLVKKYNINYILLNDELFAGDKKWLLEFCKGVKKYNLKWQAQLRVDIVDEELILLLKDAGCIYISYGLESASRTILKSMRKHITIEQIETALELTKKHDILIQGNFIFGDQAETIETMVETLHWWFAHQDYKINLSHLIPYPGTALYHYAIEQNLFKDSRIEYLKNSCARLKELNLTQIPDNEFKMMLHVILGNLRPGNFEAAHVLECKLLGCDPYQGYYYSVLIECPYCKAETMYSPIHSKYVKHNLRVYRDFGFGCRECNQRMTFMPPEIEQQLFDNIKDENRAKFLLLGVDNKTDLFIKSSFFAQNYCVAILSEQQNEIKNIKGIPVISIEQIKASDIQFYSILQIAKIPQTFKTIIEEYANTGVQVFDLSDELRFLDVYNNKEQIQDHLNYNATKINEAKIKGNLDEVSFFLINLLELFPSTMDIHRNLLENALKRSDFKLFFEVCFTMASLLPSNDFTVIKNFLLNVFPKLLGTKKIKEAEDIINVLLFNNPQEDNQLIVTLRNQLNDMKQSI